MGDVEYQIGDVVIRTGSPRGMIAEILGKRYRDDADSRTWDVHILYVPEQHLNTHRAGQDSWWHESFFRIYKARQTEPSWEV